MSEFLKNNYFFNEKSPSYILIPEKDDFLKGKFCLNFWKIRTLLKENLLVLPEFLKKSTLLKENPLKMSKILKNRYFFNEKSSSYILIPEKDDFLKGGCSSFAWIF
jgi:hypothetical protein